jgi:hypothetical protein
LLFLICTEGCERGVVDLSSISFASAMPGERRIHNYEIELTMANPMHEVSDLLSTSSTCSVSGSFYDVEGRLLFQKV